MVNELDGIQSVINSFKSSMWDTNFIETINGVNFYYSPEEITLIDDILQQLYDFSLLAGDTAYSVYKEDKELIIY